MTAESHTDPLIVAIMKRFRLPVLIRWPGDDNVRPGSIPIYVAAV